MDWIKTTIRTTSEGVEPVFGVLLSRGITGAEIFDFSDLQQNLVNNPLSWDYVDEGLLSVEADHVLIEFYVTPDEAGKQILHQIKEDLSFLPQLNPGVRLGDLSLTTATVDDNTWLNEWKKTFKPFRIGKRIMIVPAWENYYPMSSDITCIIDPGSVFGTGQHQTTRLCAEALENYLRPGNQLLDIGCGSGILSIIGLLLEARFVFACDFDPAASIAVYNNLNRNSSLDTSLLHMQTGDIFTDENLHSALSPFSFDIIVANIVADPVIQLSAVIHRWLAPDGLFIASGIIPERIGDVKETFITQTLSIKQITERDGWYCLVAGYA
jgi:ribosomal protein L11 methyltransferase